MKQRFLAALAAAALLPLIVASGCTSAPAPSPTAPVSPPETTSIPTPTPIPTLTPAPTPTLTPAPTPTLTPAPTPTPIPTPTPKPGWAESLTPEDLAAAQAAAEAFYASSPFALLALRLADDDHYLYTAEYTPGEAVVFEAETTHAGPGIYRAILLLKTETGWTVANEGY
ncbi:MAG: hypothetical protein LBT60_00825 [Oscillospiraceae bacterium]|nr:hypothetical protein [Oscillospiraceae bacterium]